MSKRYFYWCVFWLAVGFLQLVFTLDLSSVTESVGLGSASGVVAALADFNADKLTDVFVLNTTGKVHNLYLWNREANSFQQNQITLDVPLPVVQVAVADFDGDGVIDIISLSSVSPSNSECYQATVHWCDLLVNKSVVVKDTTRLNETLKGSPLILDYNGDHVADVASTTCDGSYAVWISQVQRKNFTKTILASSDDNLSIHSSYFVDLNSDCRSDLVTFGTAGSLKQFNVWQNNSELSSIPLPDKLQNKPIVGIPVFADMNGDGVMEAVLFSCYDNNCKQTAVHVLHFKKEFPGLDVLRCYGDTSWKLTFEPVIDTVNLTHTWPVIIRDSRPVVGDVNLDGFPDVIVRTATNNSQLHPLILLGGYQGKKLLPVPDVFDRTDFDNTTQVMFFDLGEDGILDILLVQGNGSGGRVTAFKQRLNEDHTFLKVLVVSGHCFSDCGVQPYGSVLPGATVSFSTTDRNGHKEQSVAVVRGNSDSPLQLPFVLFGLGETPNFIELLTIGAAYAAGNDSLSVFHVSSRQWSLLVPNSQVIVFTQPPDNSKSWKVELYLTPSQLVYSTAGVLGAIAVGIAIIIALLQAREKYQDSKERKQAKHRFHFNAM